MWQLDLLSWSVFYAFVVVSWVALCLSFVAFLFCGMQCVCHLVCLYLGFVFGCCFSCILADETRTGFLLLLSGLEQTACDPLLGLVGLGGWAEAAGRAGNNCTHQYNKQLQSADAQQMQCKIIVNSTFIGDHAGTCGEISQKKRSKTVRLSRCRIWANIL